jgi:hypothetical protein
MSAEQRIPFATQDHFKIQFTVDTAKFIEADGSTMYLLIPSLILICPGSGAFMKVLFMGTHFGLFRYQEEPIQKAMQGNFQREQLSLHVSSSPRAGT